MYQIWAFEMLCKSTPKTAQFEVELLRLPAPCCLTPKQGTSVGNVFRLNCTIQWNMSAKAILGTVILWPLWTGGLIIQGNLSLYASPRDKLFVVLLAI